MLKRRMINAVPHLNIPRKKLSQVLEKSDKVKSATNDESSAVLCQSRFEQLPAANQWTSDQCLPELSPTKNFTPEWQFGNFTPEPPHSSNFAQVLPPNNKTSQFAPEQPPSTGHPFPGQLPPLSHSPSLEPLPYGLLIDGPYKEHSHGDTNFNLHNMPKKRRKGPKVKQDDPISAYTAGDLIFRSLPGSIRTEDNQPWTAPKLLKRQYSFPKKAGKAKREKLPMPENDDENSVSSEGCIAMPVPQLKLDSNGQIILDEQSLVVLSTSAMKRKKIKKIQEVIYE